MESMPSHKNMGPRVPSSPVSNGPNWKQPNVCQLVTGSLSPTEHYSPTNTGDTEAHTGYNMDGPWKHVAEREKQDTGHTPCRPTWTKRPRYIHRDRDQIDGWLPEARGSGERAVTAVGYSFFWGVTETF